MFDRNRFITYSRLLLIVLTLALVCVLYLGTFTGVVLAEEKVYSDVLYDLQKDSNFAKNDYPIDSQDNSLQVIQIAESEDKELFIYVYQPNGDNEDLRATSINISTAINDSLKYKNYKLELIDQEGVFCKYIVKDFVVLEDVLRYYDISSIFRKYCSGIDKPADKTTQNVISEVSFGVAKLYTAVTFNGQVSYTCTETTVIEITDKYVGYLQYSNGFELVPSSCLAYYVAFDTDLPIEKLFEADIYFDTRDYTYYHRTPNWAQLDPGEDKWTYGDTIQNEKTLTYDEVVEHEGDGWFAKEYSWKRIESVDEFVANEELTETAIGELQNKTWILRFFEADYSTITGSNSFTTQSTEVSNVTILRLKFETDGVVYNLGVVDNKQSPTINQGPDNENTMDWELPSWDDLPEWFVTVLMVLAIVVVLVIFGPILPYIVKAVIWIVSLPFRFIGAIVKRIKQAQNRRE